MKDFGHLGFTLRAGDQVVIDNQTSIIIGKISGGCASVSIRAPKDVLIQRISTNNSDRQIRSWTKEKPK